MDSRPEGSPEECGDSFDGGQVLTRSCVIADTVVASVRLLYRCPSAPAAYRSGERWGAAWRQGDGDCPLE